MSRVGTPAREAVDSAATAIAAAGSPTARLDAEVLVAHVLGIERLELFAGRDLAVSGSAVRELQDLVRRRAVLGEPVAYLVGRRGFRHIELAVDRRVLIPRPETELLVEVALGLPLGARVIDVGTGSGAVALALKHERPDLQISASDVSPEALEVARANRDRLGLDVELIRADLLDGLGNAWDAVLSNPPYIADRDRGTLPRDVVAHEPAQALFAGPDGLDVIRRLVRQVAATDASRVAIEVGEGQAAEVAVLLGAAGFGDAAVLPDLAGVGRVVSAAR